MPASCVTVVVTEVALGKDASPPKSFGTAAIGELAVFTELDSPDGPERLVADLATAPDCAARLPLLIGLGPAGGAAHRAGGAGREGLRARVPGRGADDARAGAQEPPRARGAGVRGGGRERQGGAAGRRRARARDGGARVAAGGAAGVGQGGRRRSGARGARARRASTTPRAAEVLVDALGRGPVPVRAAVVGAIAKRAEAARRRRARGDRRRVRTTAARARPTCCARCRRWSSAIPARRAEAIGSLRAALAPERSFEVRGPRGDGARDAGAARAIPARWRSCASTATSPCCATWRRASCRRCRPAPAPAVDVRPALRGALGDPDPRVRETAALALGQHNDAESAPALIAGAKQEPWPFVRRAELEALGHLCTPGAGDLMLRAVARDVDEVRRAGAGRAGALQGPARRAPCC